MRRLAIVRHGNTFRPGQAPRRIGRRTDLPLTDEGMAQADRLGRWFATQGWHFSGALAGDLRRTRDTAARVVAMQRAACEVEPVPWLTEIDHGPDERQPENAVLERVGQAAIEAWDRAGIVPAGWLVDRNALIEAWRSLLACPFKGDLLLVTSSGIARFALLALPVAARPPSLKLRTGAYGIVVLAEGQGPALVGWDLRPPETSS